jgi:hypothetical protein
MHVFSTKDITTTLVMLRICQLPKNDFEDIEKICLVWVSTNVMVFITPKICKDWMVFKHKQVVACWSLINLPSSLLELWILCIQILWYFVDTPLEFQVVGVNTLGSLAMCTSFSVCHPNLEMIQEPLQVLSPFAL